MVSLGVVFASLTTQAKQQPNAWIYFGERNDSLFTLTVRKANKGVECTFVIKVKNEKPVCLDMGFFRALAGTEPIEIDDLMTGAVVYHRTRDHGLAVITIPLPEEYTGAEGSNTIGRYAKFELISNHAGTVLETPLLELCP
jgi:hypothetical protein